MVLIDPTQLVVEGEQRTIAYARTMSGAMPAKEFLDDLQERGGANAAPDLARLDRLFERMSVVGAVHNVEQFRKLRGEIFEFKSNQLRVLAFRVDTVWFLTSGFTKRQRKCPPSEIVRAESIRAEQLQQLGNST